jgi:hypothetical protein
LFGIRRVDIIESVLHRGGGKDRDHFVLRRSRMKWNGNGQQGGERR